MDPLSITTAVVTLTGVCLTTVKRISTLRDRFKLTLTTLTAILSETTVVSASLGQVQTALLRADSQFAARFERDSVLLQTLDTALIGCSVVVLALQDEVDRLEVGLLKAQTQTQTQTQGEDGKTLPLPPSPSQLGWKLRVKVLWKETAMKELLTQIRGQQASLGFLLQALAIDSMADLNSLIAKNSITLARLSEGTSTLRNAYPSIRAPRSLFDVDRDDGVSFFSHTASSAGATEFDFDNFLIDSPVYRRAFMGGYLRPRIIADCDSERSAGDTETIKEVHDGDKNNLPSQETETDFASEETTLAPSSEFEKQSDTNQTNGASVIFGTVTVKAAAGGLVEMNIEDIEKVLAEHELLIEKYRKVKKYYFDKDAQVQVLMNEKGEMSKVAEMNDDRFSKLVEVNKLLFEGNKIKAARISNLEDVLGVYHKAMKEKKADSFVKEKAGEILISPREWETAR